jgi:hypothetical protein
MSFNIQTHREVTQVETRQDSAVGIMRWGRNNSFPQTLRNLIAQSPTAKPAVARTAKFYSGAGFKGDNVVVSPYGLTLKNVVNIMADDYAHFEAFALQCNFNLKGQVTGINPMRITDLRFNEFDELNFASKIGYHPNFGLNSEVVKNVANTVTKDKIKWFDRYNPGAVEAQIKNAGTIGNYLGQLLYHSEAGHSSYPIPVLQAPVNYVLADIENSILVRKETATGFVNTYLLKTTLGSEDPNLQALESAIESAQGARGSGKVITFADLSPEDVQSILLEEIGGGKDTAIIDSATKAYDLNHKVIMGSYLIPPILAGAEVKTGFDQNALKDAYFVFNSITEVGRMVIQDELNRILKNSVFSVQEIEIEELSLNVKVMDEDGNVIVEEGEGEPATDVPTNANLTNLTGRQLQNIQRTVRKFNKEELTYDQASTLLKNGFGFNEDEVNIWLVKEEEEIEEIIEEKEDTDA